MKKIKHYRLPIRRTFPATHPKAGEETNFVELINWGIDGWFTNKKKYMLFGAIIVIGKK